ncbi:hypothetical protein ABH19_01625 [Leptospirillum sp. Group II 'CF-1']|nr:hypothetical protein ABH19_01625 [Leptospirillum sp. Group II 'CF-1']
MTTRESRTSRISQDQPIRGSLERSSRGSPGPHVGQERFPGLVDIADLGEQECLVAEGKVVGVDEVVPEFAFEAGPDRTQYKVQPSRERPIVDWARFGYE